MPSATPKDADGAAAAKKKTTKKRTKTTKKKTTKKTTKTTKKKTTKKRTKTTKKKTTKKRTKTTKKKSIEKTQRLRVRQVRSGIRHPWRMRRTLTALGLKHHQDEVVVADNPSIRGMLRTVHHLISVTPEDTNG